MPQNRAAGIPAAGQILETGTAPYEQPGPKEVVIKNYAVAIDPVVSGFQGSVFPIL